MKYTYALVLTILIICKACKNETLNSSTSASKKEKEKGSLQKPDNNCDFVFGAASAIECAHIAEDISGYNDEWPKGTNSTLFFKRAENNMNLKVISFCYITIDSLTPSIAKIPNLEELYLTRGTIRKIPPYIDALKKLKRLILGDSKTECGGNPIEEISPNIGNCQALEYLGLAFSNIDDLPIELTKCPNLKTIDLSENTKIDKKKLSELKKRFSGIEIISHLE
jgi:hypothetical protein